jgi:hypothetical protein
LCFCSPLKYEKLPFLTLHELPNGIIIVVYNIYDMAKMQIYLYDLP